MPDKVTVNNSEQETTKKEKVVSLFKFIEQLNKLKQKVTLRVSDYPWYRPISSFPNDPENIKVFYQDRVDDDDTDTPTDILLSVHKPDFQRCPEPSSSFSEWLVEGWEDYHQEADIKRFILRPLNEITLPEDLSPRDLLRVDEENQTYKEYFEDEAIRIEEFDTWKQERASWCEQQKCHAKARDFFTELYKITIDLERESETLELVVADGFIQDRDTPSIDHPILTRRVKLQHNAAENTIYIKNTDVESELYTIMFQNMEDINLASINRLNDDLHSNDYHPLDRNDLPAFFKVFIHQLSSNSVYSDNGIPENWQKKDRLLLYRNPCYILRKRMNGALKAVEQIIDNIEKTGHIPNPIKDIVEGGKIDVPADVGETSIEEQLASVGGESVDILLSKEANKEQLEIARRIERYNAVLVQGPPGTGKTHTIANLMGHFLAQGKSVLVTSHTSKALSVLKEKIPEGLQSLCVSMLDDSNIDMEKSIDGITSYMSHSTSFEVKKEVESLGRERKQIINDLASVRKKLFSIINQECNCIVYNGESISPSAAALYVQENSETLSYIPGKIRLYEPLPLSFAELSDLYKSNEDISVQDEVELENDLPNPEEIMSPYDFEQKQNIINFATIRLNKISQDNQWKIQNSISERKVLVSTPFGQLALDYPDTNAVNQLKEFISSFSDVEPWMQYCAVDGQKGEAYRNLWITLINQIQKTCNYAETLVPEQFGKKVEILNQDDSFSVSVEQLREKYSQNAKIGKFALLFNKQLEVALNGATINGNQPQNVEDCNLIIHVIEMNRMRAQCASYWNDLIAKRGVPEFYELDASEPERVASNYIPLIKQYLEWYQTAYEVLKMRMEAVGLPCDIIFQHNTLDSEIVSTEKILAAVCNTIPKLCNIFDDVQVVLETNNDLEYNKNVVQSGKRVNSVVCAMLLSAMESCNISDYRNAYAVLEKAYAKYALKFKRELYLNRLEPIAKQWAAAIKNRNGIHGHATVPDDIEAAWKWKQYCGIIEEITAEPFEDLQKKSLSLSKQYRKITAMFAEKSAWYHLLHRTENDISMKQALVGWKQTVKKIGKGTGKNAPMYRAEARKLMVKCQNAVPGWIMPMGKALESLNPQKNSFDIIIIDEASQSDISSLAILYMGKKLVIVGDDKQVSPMAVGIDVSKMNMLKEIYLAGKIPNAHLYDAKTSIYDIAATTFQPLMLREHFRCVPEIIGFSNWLSYDFKIKPLRDCSNSVLLPAVVNYRVENGERVGKTNPNEAKAIVALMQACMEQPEYKDKTFGVISLLGDEQVKKLQEEIYKNIDPRECSKHRILCGNASNFQGDERDVIFLSVVECANGQGPVSKQGFGVDDAYRKRYNVAVSRAKDQIWVVDSLDPANDLKPGDIRKQLIDYSLNPESVAVLNAAIEEKAESPFESAVAKYLAGRGYHLVQQWKVGAYRLDMVAVCGTKKVAIECDGERYHSGEDKIREDMERQTILERLGWQFIRIRGSEYYRSPDKTMERVVSELTELGIDPEDASTMSEVSERNSELLQRVKSCAHAILCRESNEDYSEFKLNTIAAALDSKNDTFLTSTAEKQHDTGLNPKAMVPNLKIEKTVPKFKVCEKDTRDSANCTTEAVQIVIPGMNEQEQKDNDIIKLLNSMGVEYVDRRTTGGRLWIIGGTELSDVVMKAKALDYKFHFAMNGHRVTNYRPSWWTYDA